MSIAATANPLTPPAPAASTVPVAATPGFGEAVKTAIARGGAGIVAPLAQGSGTGDAAALPFPGRSLFAGTMPVQAPLTPAMNPDAAAPAGQVPATLPQTGHVAVAPPLPDLKGVEVLSNSLAQPASAQPGEPAIIETRDSVSETAEAAIVAGDEAGPPPMSSPPAASSPVSLPSSGRPAAKPAQPMVASSAPAVAQQPAMMVALAASPAVVADAQTAEVSAVGEDALPDDATSDGAPTSSSGGTLAAPTLPAPVVPLPIASAGAAVMTPADPSAGQPNVATLPQTATPPLRTAAAERSGEAVPTPAAAADAPAAAGFAERLANSLPAGAAPPRPDAAASQGALLAGVQPTTQPAAAPAAAVATPTLPAHAPTVAAQPGRIGREMGVEIARRLTDGGSELTVRLNPGEMGRIEVKMSFNEHGTLRATVAAESTAALDLLRRDSADLGRALTDAGVRADAQSFRFDTRSGTGDGGQWQRQEQSGGSPSGSGSGRGYAADLPGEEPVYRALRTSGRVDLMA